MSSRQVDEVCKFKPESLGASSGYHPSGGMVMRALHWTVAFLLSGMGTACGGARTTTSTAPTPAAPSGQTWADEFDGPSNSAPDRAKWTYDLGGGGWGNQELETYTNLPSNAYLDGAGHLVIRVERNGSTFTSARLKTQGLFSARYGRIESRIRLPFGQGIWPAFWMLGTNITTTGWPGCGEIDIMENIGREPSINHGGVHGPGIPEETRSQVCIRSRDRPDSPTTSTSLRLNGLPARSGFLSMGLPTRPSLPRRSRLARRGSSTTRSSLS